MDANELTTSEVLALVNTIAEESDGGNMNNLAVIRDFIGELQRRIDERDVQIERYTTENGRLKQENFKLFSRYGGRESDVAAANKQPPVQEQEEVAEEEADIKEILDEKGFWKED